MNTHVKICGITQVLDAQVSVKLGASSIGVNFYPKSKRYIDIKRSKLIRSVIPNGVLLIGVFVDASIEHIINIKKEVGLDGIQLHGNETLEFANNLRKKLGPCLIIKAISSQKEANEYKDSGFNLLVDAPPSENDKGGRGVLSDWVLAKGLNDIFLAGGLGPDNIAEAILNTQVNKVDICSGVEDGPGIKSESKLEDLFRRINDVK